MDEIERAHIEAACQRLSFAFSVLVDRNDAEGVSSLFLPDGSFNRSDMSLDGADQIRAFLKNRSGTRITRHVCANILIDVEDESNASGITYFTLYEGERAGADEDGPLAVRLPLTVGEYHDRYKKTEDGWRIAERRSVAVFRRL